MRGQFGARRLAASVSLATLGFVLAQPAAAATVEGVRHVNLKLTRIAFDVPALNDNGVSVGEGLECIYDVSLTGGIADMLADLFLFTDAVNYTSVLTPYLNYDYVNAKLKSFEETGGNGADLTVWGGRAKHSFLTGGVKWATQMGGVVPEVNLGYRYRLGDKRSDFSAAFLGAEACDFDIISAAQKKGTFLAGVSVGG